MNHKFFRRNCLFFLMMIGSLLCMKNDVTAVQADEECTGLELPTKEEEEFLNSIPVINWVNLNEDALKIIKNKNFDAKVLERIKIADIGEEFVSEQNPVSRASELDSRKAQKEAVSQISAYDVSKNDTFPAIGDQGTTGSCTAWSMGYYQLTNNIAKVRNLDVKHNGTKYCVAPGWIYNICKTEKNNNVIIDGTNESSILSVLMKQGAPYWSAAYGQTTMTNYTSWHPGSFAWEAALENRIEKYEYISLWDDNDMLDLTGLKAALLNGYVVSFASYYSKDPVYGTRDWIMEGEAMIKGMKKIPDRGVSGHEMTIVGFDDSVKVDYGIHPVTKQRQYGYGALKIANSWGTSSGDKGYYWMAYDALKKVSEFTGSHTADRVPGISGNRVLLITPRKTYTPLLMIKLTVETNSRRQLALALDVNQDVNENYMRYIYRYQNNINRGSEYNIPFWFKNYDVTAQNLNFSGESCGIGQRESAVFLFDLTDTVLQKYNQLNNRSGNKGMSFFVYIQDKVRDNYTSALTKIEIIDQNSGKRASKTTNLIVDGDIKSEKIDFTVIPRIVGEQKTFHLNFNHPIQSSSIKEGFTVEKKMKGVSGYTTSAFEVSYSQSSDRKKIILNPPAGKYENGSYYSLDLRRIQPGIQSDGGNFLTGQKVFDFYVPGY